MFSILAQHTPSPEQMEDLQRSTIRWWRPAHYLHAVLEGGWMNVAVHLVMLGAIIYALMEMRRGRLGRRTLVACFLPFVCGATSMWLHVVGLQAVALGQEVDLVRALADAQLPFFAGGSITIALMLVSRFAAGRKAARAATF